ncbi:hypothetical protein U1Q18_050054 [Sarracenia purpurea var. burkii]
MAVGPHLLNRRVLLVCLELPLRLRLFDDGLWPIVLPTVVSGWNKDMCCSETSHTAAFEYVVGSPRMLQKKVQMMRIISSSRSASSHSRGAYRTINQNGGKKQCRAYQQKKQRNKRGKQINNTKHAGDN